MPRELQDVLFDPQTSGGLLISVTGIRPTALVAALKDGGVVDAALIGEIMLRPGEDSGGIANPISETGSIGSNSQSTDTSGGLIQPLHTLTTLPTPEGLF